MPERLKGLDQPTKTGNSADGSAQAMRGAENFVGEMAKSVLNIRGILRLEPQLKDITGKLDPTRALAASKSKIPEGIRVHGFGPLTNVTVDVAISSSSQALATAEQIQNALRDLIYEHGREPGRIVVNILAIEHH